MKTPDTFKEKSKKICSLSVYVIAVTMITPPLALAVPPFQANQGTVNQKFRNISNDALGCSSDSTRTSCFSAASGDDFYTGEPEGTVRVWIGSTPNESGILCNGSAYVGILSVNPANGNTSLKATLNPSDPSCTTWNNWNEGTVTVNLSGSYTDGGDRRSSSTQSKTYSNGTTSRSTSKYDEFSQTFTGSITGLSGPWTGSATVSRDINFEIVK